MRRSLTVLILVLLGVSTAGAVDSLRRIDDSRLLGTVTSVDMAKGVTISVPGEGGEKRSVTVPLDEVLSMRFGDAAKTHPPVDDLVMPASGERWFVHVTGTDGTRMTMGPGKVLAGTCAVPFADLRVMVPYRERVKVTVFTCPMHPDVRIKERGKTCPVCGMELVPATVESERTEPFDPRESADRLMKLDNEQDLLLMTNGDRLPGVIESVAPKQVSLSSKLGRVSVPVDKVQTVAFSKTLKPWTHPPGLQAEVHLVDGSLVLGKIVGPVDGKYLLTSVAGPEWKVDASNVERLGVRGGKLAWLSDLEPDDVKLTPFFNRTWEVRRNLSVWGNPLRVAGTTYDRGLGVHAKTELTYDLDGKFAAFVAELGVDDETNKTGSVAFSVLGDGKTLLEPVALTGGAKPKPVKVDVKGVKKLTLIADFAGDDDMGDHADWLNARLVKE